MLIESAKTGKVRHEVSGSFKEAPGYLDKAPIILFTLLRIYYCKMKTIICESAKHNHF